MGSVQVLGIRASVEWLAKRFWGLQFVLNVCFQMYTLVGITQDIYGCYKQTARVHTTITVSLFCVCVYNMQSNEMHREVFTLC